MSRLLLSDEHWSKLHRFCCRRSYTTSLSCAWPSRHASEAPTTNQVKPTLIRNAGKRGLFTRPSLSLTREYQPYRARVFGL